ncbi:MAG: outer membrane lipid asymmetry maintenance protein MlaD [endosymbiont of Galathealinum brachiosum]|uniref:Outer membrane lipid asymmetry maintenance protein MlaD n=1 Tax=endosymbiont of Galathealinum brachiosum TaxID=2200906 RepID=A0A370D900_9GAMM|nr:MAG: outer membrane lipid asymmetry maintenance protein MlaD [endosymbiont of Galathealinum brachiosum]
MNTRNIEILVGGFVVLAVIAMVMLSLKVSNLASYGDDEDAYEIIAQFDNIGGLKERSPVSAGGVRVGKVSAIDYNNEEFTAVVTMQIQGGYQFPIDTSASILTAGLLGEQYVGLEPGGDEENLVQGGEIDITQSALVLEQVIGQFLYSKAQEE